MMNLEIKSIHSPDMEIALEKIEHLPNQGRCLFFELDIGEVNKESSFVFGVVVATTFAYEETKKKYPRAVLSPIIFTEDWRWDSIREELMSRVRISGGTNWENTIRNLKRFFYFLDEPTSFDH